MPHTARPISAALAVLTRLASLAALARFASLAARPVRAALPAPAGLFALASLARNTWLDLLSLLWPVSCTVCDAPDRQLCDPCRDALRAKQGQTERLLFAAGVACVAGPYEGPLRALLIDLKHGGVTSFARVLGAHLSAPLCEALSDAGSPVLVVTVPSRPARVRERGYRHVDLLVRAALRQIEHGRGGIADRSRAEPHHQAYFLPRALRTLRGRTGQVGLSSSERVRNASRVSVDPRARSRLSGAPVILVDDIITTGATMTAAVHALEAAGARVVGVVALCAVVRRDASTAPN